MKDHQMRRLYTNVTSAVIAVTALAALSSRADAQSVSSLYTSTAEKDCRVKDTPPDGSISICPGKGGLIVVLTEADARQTVSVGRNPKAAENEPAASQSFRPFNSTTNTVEWRIANGRPFAIIQRWHISDNEEQDKNGRPVGRNLMVVTRLPPGPVCHVAYIDARANPNPSELARKAADEIARGFTCGKDQMKVVGERGRATELGLTEK
jgi:hypothetical protein